MRTIKYKEFFLSLTYMIVINPVKLKFFGSYQMIFFYAFLIFYILLNNADFIMLFKNMLSAKKYVKKMIIVFFVTVIMSIIMPILHSTYDFSFFSHVIGEEMTYTIKVLFLLLLTKRCLIKKHNLACSFMHFFSGGMCFYVGFTIFFLLFPSLKATWVSLIIDSEKNQVLSLYRTYITRYGISGFSGFKVTYYCTIAVIFVLFCLTERSLPFKKKKLYFRLFILLIGNMFYGRSGLVCSAVCILLAMSYHLFIQKRVQLLFSIFLFILIVVFAIAFLRKNNSMFETWYNWFFEALGNFFETGKLSTGSTDALFGMYFLPSLKTMIVGDGFYTNPYGKGYYMGTDVGIMRQILFYGVGGLICAYMVPIYGMIGIKKMGVPRSYQLLSLLLCLQMIMFELKGEVAHKEGAICLAVLIGIFSYSGAKYSST